MAKILYGAPVREEIKQKLMEQIAKLRKEISLAIIQVGDRPDSNIYIRNKQKFGEEVGVKVILKKFGEDISEKELIAHIEELNKDKEVNGIIVQLPLPESLDAAKIILSIKKEKDADGLRQTKEISGEVMNGPLVTPATARAVMSLLDYYGLALKGKKAVVIGRSRLAGAPIAEALEQRGITVNICHRETLNTALICNAADILVSAAGRPGLVTRDFVKEGQVVIDVGINRVEGKEKPKLVGDVAFEEVEPVVGAISPVPGGVGPLTVVCLFQNLLDLCYNKDSL